MKHSLGLVAIGLLITTNLLTSCAGASAPSSKTCQTGVCVQTQVIEPVELNKPVRVIVTVETEKDVTGLEVSVGVTEPSILFDELHEEEKGKDGTRKWVKQIREAKARAPIQMTTTIRFTQEGFFYVYGTAYDRQLGLGVSDIVRVQITSLGGKVYLPGTPIPITPGPVPTLAPWMRTPSPTPIQPTTPIRPPYP